MLDGAGDDGAADTQSKTACDAAVAVDERRRKAPQEILSVLLSPRAVVRRASRYEHGPLPEPVGDCAQKLGDIAVLFDCDSLDVEP